MVSCRPWYVPLICASVTHSVSSPLFDLTYLCWSETERQAGGGGLRRRKQEGHRTEGSFHLSFHHNNELPISVCPLQAIMHTPTHTRKHTNTHRNLLSTWLPISMIISFLSLCCIMQESQCIVCVWRRKSHRRRRADDLCAFACVSAYCVQQPAVSLAASVWGKVPCHVLAKQWGSSWLKFFFYTHIQNPMDVLLEKRFVTVDMWCIHCCCTLFTWKKFISAHAHCLCAWRQSSHCIAIGDRPHLPFIYFTSSLITSPLPLYHSLILPLVCILSLYFLTHTNTHATAVFHLTSVFSPWHLSTPSLRYRVVTPPPPLCALSLSSYPST